MKRIIIATLFGLLFGFICFSMASFSGNLAWPVGVQIILSRTLIGFAIGISCLKLYHWSIHGIIMGLVFSLPLAFSSLMAPENSDFTPKQMLISILVMGVIYGFLTELFTSFVFKAKQK